MIRALSLFLLALGLAVAGTATALAHASLLRSDPSDGSVLASAPRTLSLAFNEPVSPLVLRLVEADGTAIDLAGVEARGETVTAPLPALRTGSHALSWRVVSADGHPVGGSLVFSIGAAGAVPAASESATPPLLAVLIWMTRVALYLGVFIGVGGSVFATWIAPLPPMAARTVSAGLGLGLAAIVPALGLQGLDALGVGLPGLFDAVTWRAGMATSYATTLLLAVVVLALALGACRLRGPAARRGLAALALAGVGTALALSGHASAAAPQALMRPAVAVHAACVTIWIGALVPLAALMAGRSAEAEAALMRFSRIIPYALLLLAGSGAVLAVVQLGRVEALWTTTYGRVLAVKLALVAGLLGLAALNRFRLTPRVSGQVAGAPSALRRSIAAEVVLAVAILGTVAAWRFTPPPRALAQQAAAVAPIHRHIHGGQAMADLTLTPGRAGPVALSLSILDGDFGPLAAREVAITFANAGAGLEPIRRRAVQVEGADWRVDGLVLPAAGRWQVRVTILISEFDQVTLEDAFDLSQ